MFCCVPESGVFLRTLLISATILMAGCQTLPRASDLQANHVRAVASVTAVEDQLIEFRHDLHRHPELSGQEARTSMLVAERLRSLGYEVRTNVGGHGVVGVLRGQAPGAENGPTIGFRADMDASRDFSVDPVSYSSVVEGVRHNCGHDLHTTVGIGLAIGLAEIRSTLPGNIVLIFQPAEEAGTGAEAMLADGVFASVKPEAILAVHTFPMELGVLASHPGSLLAGRARLSVTLRGNGELDSAASDLHAALMAVSTIRPEAALEPTTPDFIYLDLAPPRKHPVEPEVVVSGLVMSAGIENRPEIRRKVMQAIDAVQLPDVEVLVDYSQALEGVDNDPSVLRRSTNAMSALEAQLQVRSFAKVFPAFSEDFGSFQKHTPGVMYFLGVNNAEAGTVGFPHSPDYVADDAAILVGVRAMLSAVLALMDSSSQ